MDVTRTDLMRLAKQIKDIPKGDKGDTGINGSDGITPHIGLNSNWYIGETDTGIKAEGTQGDTGSDGITPHIGLNGNWYIGETDTSIHAQGIQGIQGETGEISAAGWVSAGETWTYSSVDDPTGLITIVGDVTDKYSLGMKIKFVNDSNTIYGKISKAPTYSSPNTTITFLHEIDSSDSLALHLMADSAITNNYYSVVDAPLGFPKNPDKWSVFILDTGSRQVTPTADVWYNPDYPSGVKLAVPIGIWNLEYSTLGIAGEYTGTMNYENALWLTLSTTNNSESDKNFTAIARHFFNIAATERFMNDMFFKHKIIELATKTTYYLNIKTTSTGIELIGYGFGDVYTIIKAVFAA